MMMYSLLTLAIILISSSVTADARQLRGDLSLGSPHLAHNCNDARANTNQASARGSLTRFPQEYNDMKIGDWVEVYEPKINSSYAFFAQIVGIILQEDCSAKFMIKSGPQEFDFVEEVDSSSVQAHDEPYEFNTPATCDLGGSRYGFAKLAPCTILSQHQDVRDYYYVLIMLDGVIEENQLPLSRIRRLVDTSSGNFKPGITHPDPSSRAHDDGLSNPLRGVVEVYGDTSIFAQPSIVTNHNGKVSSADFNYSLQDTVHNMHKPKIDPEFVHPYRVYEAETKAFCNISATHDVYLIPCTVHHHSLKDIGFVDYQISYRNKYKTLIPMTLSFSKVQRIR